METLFDYDKNILENYQELEKANFNNWNIDAYLNMFYDLNAALAFSKLFYPDFLEEKGCVILKSRYNKTIFEDWYQEFNEDKSLTEKMCNLYELKDFFHINSPKDNSTIYNYKLDILSKILKISWEVNLKILFPKSKYVVKVFEEFDEMYITFYSEN